MPVRPSSVTAKTIEERYRSRATAVAKVVKWPAIGALFGGGLLLVGYLIGPKVVEQLGQRAGEGFARGAQEQMTRGFSISGWGTYRSTERGTLAASLRQLPGLVGHGVVLQNLGAPRERQVWAYEVRWLRGQPLPVLPTTVDGYPVKLAIVDSYPVPYRNA